MSKIQLSSGKDPYQLVEVNTNGNIQVDLEESSAIIPIDIQSRLQTTIQTHNAVSVAANNGSLQTSWIDTDGFDKVAITILNDAATSSNADLYWSNDGSATHGIDYLIVPSSTNRYRTTITDIKARYLKVNVGNGDTVAHTMSAWAFLKA